MSCGQVAMNMNNLVAMRSSCPRPEATVNNKSKQQQQQNDDDYFTGVEIHKPGPHDVLLGRGGGTNNHGGNIKFRRLVNEHKMRYLACSKLEKPTVAREVVALWRKMEPAGRFLVRKDEGKKPLLTGRRADEQTIWLEVGDKRAREKASQCLRERTADVVPYIQQLHAQNDHLTAEGVTLVSQQLRMQQEAKANTQAQMGGFHNNGAAAFPQGMSMPDQQVSSGHGHGAADFSSNRRGSLPSMQTSSNNLPREQQQQQQHQQSFGRRFSAPHLQHGEQAFYHGAGDPNEIAMMQAQAQMQMQMGGGQYGIEPGFIPSNSAGTMYGECDAAYAQQLEFQHHQQMQLQAEAQALEYQRQMMMEQQEHMRMQREYSQLQQQREWNMQPMQGHSGHRATGMDPLGQHGSSLHGSNHGQRATAVDPHGHQRQARQHHQQQQIPDQTVSRGAGARSDDFDPLPLSAVSSDVPRHHEQPESIQNNNSNHSQKKKQREPVQEKPRKGEPRSPKKKKEQPPRKPQRTNKENNDANEEHAPIPLNAAHDDDNGEITLEEYRKTLANYLVNNNIQPATAEQQQQRSPDDHDKDDVSVESLTEWTEDVLQEHEKRELQDNSNKEMDNSNQDNIDNSNNRRRRGGRAPPSIRRVNRHVSGQSMMSMKSLKSTGTTLSGLSMLSDMSMDTRDRDGKMSQARGHSSSASIMSELTDISQCIDDLTLDDD